MKPLCISIMMICWLCAFGVYALVKSICQPLFDYHSALLPLYKSRHCPVIKTSGKTLLSMMKFEYLKLMYNHKEEECYSKKTTKSLLVEEFKEDAAEDNASTCVAQHFVF